MQYPRDVEGERKTLLPRYNRAGGLQALNLDGVTYVERIAYNAKGQRILIAYGNGVMTRHAYDLKTFRLVRLRSEAYTKPDAATYHPTGSPLQDLTYAYDLVGNVLAIQDRVPSCGVLNNPDAAQITDSALAKLLVAGDALIREFEYDPAGNIVLLKHMSQGSVWTRNFGMGGLTPQQWSQAWPSHLTADWFDPARNRLTHVGDNSINVAQTHFFDANGNLVRENTERHFEWDQSDRMRVFRTQVDGSEPSVFACYLYDSAGQRTKKLVRKQGEQYEVTVYVDGRFEHYRSVRGNTVQQDNTLHVMASQQRVAVARVGNALSGDASPAVKYHLGDHLESSVLVVDESGGWVNREEYTPYGETVFGSFARKRYRFTGKQRDEESGLCYHGARYYAPWVARWVSCDPLRTSSSSSYEYVRANPLLQVDPTGLAPDSPCKPRVDATSAAPTTEEMKQQRSIPSQHSSVGPASAGGHETGRRDRRRPSDVAKDIPTWVWITAGIFGAGVPAMAAMKAADMAEELQERGHASGEDERITALKATGAAVGFTAAAEALRVLDMQAIGAASEPLPKNILFSSGGKKDVTAAAHSVPATTPSPSLRGSPYHPEVVAERVRPEYRPNPAHDPANPLPRKDPEPADAADVYKTATPSRIGEWWGRGQEGWYRYFSDRAGGAHFSGVIRERAVPAHLVRQSSAVRRE
jgi:RHS repeat-associated protein